MLSLPPHRQYGLLSTFINQIRREFLETPVRWRARIDSAGRDIVPQFALSSRQDEVLLPIKTRSNDAHLPISDSESDVTASASPIPPAELTDRYQLFASFFDQLYLEKEVYAFEDRIVLRWPRKLQAPADYSARLQRTDGRIYAEATGQEGDSGDRTFTQALSIPDGDYEVILMPEANEYYRQGVRVQRRIPLSVVRSDYRTVSYGTYTERQIELLRHAVTLDAGLFSEIAKMAMGWWGSLNPARVVADIDAIERWEKRPLARLLGLLGMVNRYGENQEFPAAIRRPIDDCICGFVYQEREYAEKSRMRLCSKEARTGETLSDTDRLLLYACEILAGQRYPERLFSGSNQTGQWHQGHGEEAARRWLQRAATYGFSDTSSHSLAQLLVALSHLIDLADSAQIWDLAAVILDKALVTLALDSFQGFYGASQIVADGDATVRSGYLSPLAGVGRLLWGIGVWNQHLAAPVSLACCQEYEQPALIAALAADRPAGMWASERHAIERLDDAGKLGGRGVQIAEPNGPAMDERERALNKAIYKTPDFLLCCAQDFQPGQRGQGGQSWQATLGPDAIVFVNHPGADEADYWRSGLLPRVAQQRDILIALYRLPPDDPFGFTHAYFPISAFDERQVGKTWAFAAKGDAYIALACSQPLALAQQGAHAYRELRAYGHEVVWLCQMGRKADYGSFASFRKRALAARFACEGLSVFYRPLQGDSVTFGWDEALCVNNEAQPLQSDKHYDGPHCVTDRWPASQMVIVYDEQALRLDFD